MPTSRPGAALPMMISNGCSGETSNCSSVPSSRSRATDMLTMIITVSIVSDASRLGAITLRKSRLGLYQVRSMTSLGAAGALGPT